MSNGRYVFVAPAGVLEADCVVQLLSDAGIDTTAVLDASDTAAAVVIALPDGSLADAAARVRAQVPGLPLLLVTSDSEADAPQLSRGATSVSWRAGGSALVESVRAMLEGRGVLTHGRRDGAADPWSGLTLREQDILALLAQGRRNDEIASVLGISHHTVRTHVNRVLTKLGVPHRHAAAAMVRRHPTAWRHARAAHLAAASGEA